MALALTGVLVFMGVSASTAAAILTTNIESVDVDTILAQAQAPRPEVVIPEDPEELPPLNILVLGTDSRYGEENQALGGGDVTGIRSNITMIMQISADRDRVTMVSIPRDTIIDIPACPTTTEGLLTVPRQNARVNAAFAFGYQTGGDLASGALCAMTAVESITDIRLDGFVSLDFIGFQTMVDALGGVDMYLPQAIYSPNAGGLRLDAGWQRLDGWEALQFARARTGQGLGDGSDLGRITRQQELIAAMVTEATSRSLLTDSLSLLQFLGAATSSMTMSANFATVPGLLGLATSMQGIEPTDFEFVTAPNMPNPENRNTVVLRPEAADVWDALRNGEPIGLDS
ncbi:MAG: LCP family protein [Promicromonosporaceae bacterium]|nr:LCP family protein [Promicromonosporaceae bacterium]